MDPSNTRSSPGVTIRGLQPTRFARESHQHSVAHWLIMIATLWLSAWLLFLNLDARGLWFDEIIYVELERQDLGSILNALTVDFADHHPPAYHFAGHVWMRLIGETDFAVRSLSVFLGILPLPLVYQIGRRLAGVRLGRVAALLLAVSPLAILFTRIARYYALTTALGLLSTLLFLRLCHRPQRRRWVAYVLASALLAYTDYLAISLLIGQGLLALLTSRRVKGFLRRWFTSQLAIALLFLPWFPSFIKQATSASQWTPADLAFSPIGYVLKLVYPLYAFSVGATLFPWEPVAIAGGIVLFVLAVLGLIFMARNGGPWGSHLRLMVALIGVPFTLIFLTVTFVTPLVPFIAIPDHMVFVVPFFCLLFAAGWLHLRRRSLQLGMGLIVLATYAGSFNNYLAGSNFHNPVYAVPIGQAVDWVIAHTQPGDIITGKRDTGFAYHYDKRSHTAPYHEIGSEVYSLVDHLQPSRVWVVSFGRDRTLAGDDTPMFVQFLLGRGYSLSLSQGYVEQDQTYRQLKERLLHRPAYRYKLEAQLYTRR